MGCTFQVLPRDSGVYTPPFSPNGAIPTRRRPVAPSRRPDRLQRGHVCSFGDQSFVDEAIGDVESSWLAEEETSSPNAVDARDIYVSQAQRGKEEELWGGRRRSCGEIYCRWTGLEVADVR